MRYLERVKVYFGNELKFDDIQDPPSVKWNIEPKSLYTLCLTGNALFLFSFTLKSLKYIILVATINNTMNTSDTNQ